MRRVASKTVVLLILVAVVCYTSVRLVSVTMELESNRRDVIPRYILVQNHQTSSIRNKSGVTNIAIVNVEPFNMFTSFPSLAHLPVDCRGILEGDKEELNKTKAIRSKLRYSIPTDHDMFKEATNCETFKSVHGYNSYIVTNSEKDFPIAYSILLYKETVQLNVLLKAIYRPQNVYCLHVDESSDQSVHLATKAIADCFDNVFIVSKSEKIVYAGFSRLQADLNCMEDLLSSKVSWKYFINLPSQQYPLKTNAEIVKILRIYNGSNDIEGITGPRMLQQRYKFRYEYVTKSGQTILKKTNKLNPAPPHNITIVKGSAYGIFSRDFVKFILNDKRSKDLLRWLKDVFSPDEYYWATLHHDKRLKAPGGYFGKPDDKPWLATYATWAPNPCDGRWLRGVCVYGLGDLSSLISRPSLFANKFSQTRNPLTLMCLEQWMFNKTVSPLPFLSDYYRTLPFIHKGKK